MQNFPLNSKFDCIHTLWQRWQTPTCHNHLFPLRQNVRNCDLSVQISVAWTVTYPSNLPNKLRHIKICFTLISFYAIARPYNKVYTMLCTGIVIQSFKSYDNSSKKTSLALFLVIHVHIYAYMYICTYKYICTYVIPYMYVCMSYRIYVIPYSRILIIFIQIYNKIMPIPLLGYFATLKAIGLWIT